MNLGKTAVNLSPFKAVQKTVYFICLDTPRHGSQLIS